jgi:ABC-type multidrug transport system ATPase subunit
VDDLSFTVNEKEVYGFLGQNGAGKSTTIRMLLTLITPSAGEIEVFGLDLYKHRSEILRRTGAIIEKPDLYKYLTALENMKLFAVYSGVKLSEQKLMEQLQLVGLSDRAHCKVKTFSQGMKQRLGIAVALVHDPDLIILDEPMNGLDPQGIADVRNLINHLSKERGKTIFISSHLLTEMEQVADSLLIIHKGKAVVEGKMGNLLKPELKDVEIEGESAPEILAQLKNTKWGNDIKLVNNKKLLLHINRNEIPALIHLIGQMELPVYSIRQKNSLEDYFLSLTAH